MKKIILFLCLGIFIFSLVSAETCLKTEGCIGEFEIGVDIELYQTCNNCTYCNFTKLRTNFNRI